MFSFFEDDEDPEFEGPYVSQLEARAGEKYKDEEIFIRVENGPMWRLDLVDEDEFALNLADNWEIEEDWDAPVPPKYSVEEVLADELDLIMLRAGIKMVSEGGNDYRLESSLGSEQDKEPLDLKRLQGILDNLVFMGIEAVPVDENGESAIGERPEGDA